jgi:hypothetical protein
MSKMSDLHVEIQDRLAAGQSPDYISKWLEIPIEWVLSVDQEIAEG